MNAPPFDPSPPPQLGLGDVNSPLWISIDMWARARMRRLAVSLAQPGVRRRQTEFLRGQIAELRGLLALAEGAAPDSVSAAATSRRPA